MSHHSMSHVTSRLTRPLPATPRQQLPLLLHLLPWSARDRARIGSWHLSADMEQLSSTNDTMPRMLACDACDAVAPCPPTKYTQQVRGGMSDSAPGLEAHTPPLAPSLARTLREPSNTIHETSRGSLADSKATQEGGARTAS